MRVDIAERKEEILGWISEKKSKAFISAQLRCKPDTLRTHLIRMGIHYEGNVGGFGKVSQQRKRYDELVKTFGVSSHKLKLRMIEDGVKPHQCEVCGGTTWNGKQIPLELHHIDGDRYNNEWGNMQLLCPNCHAQTPNYSRHKNISRKPKKVVVRKLKVLNEYCTICQYPVKKRGRKFCSEVCFNQKRASDIPEKEGLLINMRTHKTFTKVGEVYNVSDKTIKNWCVRHNILEQIRA